MNDPYIHFKEKRGEQYKSFSYGELTRRAMKFAAALEQLGIVYGQRLLIVSESRPEWVVTDLAAILIGAITVPVFPTLTAKQTEYILQHSGAKAVVVSTDYQLRKILSVIDNAPELGSVIVMDSDIVLPSHSRVGFFHFSGLEVQAPDSFTMKKMSSEEVVTIIYTSGTTGIPKGVMLTHRNLVSNLEAAAAAIPVLNKNDLFLSFLPLSHSFERIASYLVFTLGVQIAFAESIDSVASNMLEVRPTVMTAVPRFFERVHTRVEQSRDKMSALRRIVFDWGLKIGNQNAAKYEGRRVSFFARLQFRVANKLVLSKIRQRTGGRIRFFVSGGAALKPDVGKAFAGLGMHIIEGYGLTETSPVVAVSRIDKLKWGTVGLPLPGIELRIADDGEILIRGANVMKGYYKDNAATNEIIDSDGWLHSGDIGIIDEAGRLKITDRKKHIIVLANGKNIAPAPIEVLLESSPFIEQAVVLGERRDYCTALVIPNSEHSNGSDARTAIEREITKINRELASYEKIRRFQILREPFTIENGLLTPTLKIRRKEVERKYNELIDMMYQQH
ncbi:MAG TPA: long-chain fatty acid--CoA ligase [Candidatus Kapabacteria bacterium]|nr:long-chain fatty acid--CoA ligase [Candidatus Kapabacteria bacterium]